MGCCSLLQAGGVRGFVLNSAAISKPKEFETATDHTTGVSYYSSQQEWIERQLEESKMNSHHSLIFTHQPWFNESFDEADGVSVGAAGGGSVPKKRRMRLLKRFRDNNVTALFCGGQQQNEKVHMPKEGGFPKDKEEDEELKEEKQAFYSLNDSDNEEDRAPAKGKGIPLYHTAGLAANGSGATLDNAGSAGITVVRLLDEEVRICFFTPCVLVFCCVHSFCVLVWVVGVHVCACVLLHQCCHLPCSCDRCRIHHCHFSFSFFRVLPINIRQSIYDVGQTYFLHPRRGARRDRSAGISMCRPHVIPSNSVIADDSVGQAVDRPNSLDSLLYSMLHGSGAIWGALNGAHRSWAVGTQGNRHWELGANRGRCGLRTA
jgi:hypothetical protein